MLLTIDGHVSKLDTEDPLIPAEDAWGRRKATVIAVKRPAQDSSDMTQEEMDECVNTRLSGRFAPIFYFNY